jgi:glycosyltransferase involved in cell wall biosynthesis
MVSPSEGIETLLRERACSSDSVIPTGIDLDFYSSGNRTAFLREHGVAADALVIGHVGRLAAEKNLDFLARAVGRYLHEHTGAVFLVVGAGDHADAVRNALLAHAEPSQVLMVGKKTGRALADAYAAMDVFVFSSQSETQGMVLAEAMAAAAPVVAIDGPGVRDVVTRENGRLLKADATDEQFAQAIEQLTADRGRLDKLRVRTQHSIERFSVEHCTDQLVELYERLVADASQRGETDHGPWDRLLARLEIEWNLLAQKTAALAAAVVETDATRTRLD